MNGNQMWRSSKHYSVSAYRVDSEPYNIMAEVYKNGPVEVSFTVYEVMPEDLVWTLVSKGILWDCQERRKYIMHFSSAIMSQ